MAKAMNIKSKLYQHFVVDKIKDTDWEKGSSAPLVVEFDTTEVCNLVCPGCISEDLVCNKNSFTHQRLLELADEMYEAGVKAVILIGGGEPLAHNGVGKFIESLGEKGIHIGITTNGVFIDKYMEAIAKYSSWTRISMDAATPETFNMLRPAKSGKNEFEHVINNMKQLSKIKKGKLGFSFLIRTEADGFGIKPNIHEIYQAAKLAREIGCDYFEVKPSYSYVDGQAHELVKHSPERMQEARVEIEKLDDLETDNFKIIKAINLESSLNCVDMAQDKDYNTCPVAELRTLVCPSGVYVCPYWRGKEQFRIGDVHTTSFKDMWNGDQRKNVMENMDISKVCHFHCLRHQSNIEIFNIINTPKEKITCVEEYDRFI